MESRIVLITLEDAKKFYNSENEELKKIALQAFSEDEILGKDFMKIKDFWDAVDFLGLDKFTVQNDLNNIKGNFSTQLISLYKLNIIKKALNGVDWEPSLVTNKYYESFVRVYRYKNDISDGEEIIGEFISNGTNYFLTGGYSSIIEDESEEGILCFDDSQEGYSEPSFGLFGCKNEEIAKYMSIQFGKLIFDVCYSQYIGLYEWC